MQDYLAVTELMEEVLKIPVIKKCSRQKNHLEAESRLENIEEFLSVTKHFEEISEDKSISCLSNRFSISCRY